MNDPEIEAMSVVAGALAELDNDTQRRVLKWAAERFSITFSGEAKFVPDSVGGREGNQSPSNDSIDVDEAIVMEALAEETGVPVEKLERVFHLDGGTVKLLGSSSKYGATTTDQARAVAQIVTVVRRVGMGQVDTSFEIIKDACESKHCYDHKNFVSHHLGKLDGFVIKGEKKARRLEAKGAGIAAFSGVIDTVLGES